MTSGPASRAPLASLTGRAVGIDGYRGGWVAANLSDGVVTWATAAVDDIGALLPDDVVVGVDMPVGLLDRGERACDALGRAALPGASSRVFTTPPRAVLELGALAPNDQAQALSSALMGKGVSRQALALGPRILSLDSHLASAPRHRVVEVHPEISFAELAGRVLVSKKSAAGVGQRVAALETWLPSTARTLAEAPFDVPVDDALDAMAALWSAVRWRDGQARTLPSVAATAPRIVV
jgi:predicted RNase H-like nuclease